ncbi:MAG: hypothetical protein Q8N77_02765 [Nanoarchaeota archaeon]|nr:hypothetical protein [Nanoarchaeota archaeon]
MGYSCREECETVTGEYYDPTSDLFTIVEEHMLELEGAVREADDSLGYVPKQIMEPYLITRMAYNRIVKEINDCETRAMTAH